MIHSVALCRGCVRLSAIRMGSHSGVVYSKALEHPSVIHSLLNTAGEAERERRSRQANAIEAFIIAAGVLTTLWPFCFGCGVLGNSDTIQKLAYVPIALFAVWTLAIGPLWHGDSVESLGLGNPLRLWGLLRQKRRGILPTITLLFGALFLVSIANWPDTARMFRLGSEARLWPLTPDGTVKMTCFAALVSAFVVSCVVRYDNFGSALRTALIISGVLVLFAGAGAVLHRGWAVFAVIDPARYPLDVIAYVFWGGMQQFVFTAYFSTRLRKAFRPSNDPANIVQSTDRQSSILIGGSIASACLAPMFWLAVRSLHGADSGSIALLFTFTAFAFPIGAVWTYFYCRDKRRMLVATLAGSFFGLIHIDSYGLVLVTFGLGITLAYVFMEDRFRNLSALALIHGFLGSTFGKLFRGEGAGPLRIDYKVGPWNIDDPSAWMLLIPLLCLAGYAGVAVWIWRKGEFGGLSSASTGTRSASAFD